MTAWIDGPGSLLRRPDAISSDFLFSFSVGPDELADPSKGLLHRVWMVDTHDGKTVTLYKSSVTLQEQLAGKKGKFGAPVELFSYTGSPIMEVDLGFDQNGNVVVCAERDGHIWLYWFDPRDGRYVFRSLGPGRTPRILLDDPETTTESDLLLFYATPDGTAVVMRQQRELYAVVHPTPATGSDLRCEEVAKASDYRLHVYYSRHNAEAGRYELVRMESAPYPARVTESVQPTHRLSGAAVAEFVKVDEGQRDDVQPLHFVNEVVLQELTLRIGPDGQEGWLAADSMTPTHTVGSVARQDLVWIHAQEPDKLRPTHRLISALVQDFVIVAPSFGADMLQPAHRISSISLVAA